MKVSTVESYTITRPKCSSDQKKFESRRLKFLISQLLQFLRVNFKSFDSQYLNCLLFAFYFHFTFICILFLVNRYEIFLPNMIVYKYTKRILFFWEVQERVAGNIVA